MGKAVSRSPRTGKAVSRSPRTGKPTLWDQASRWYDSLVGTGGSDYHRNILMPGAFRLLDVKPGRRILDLACGQGVFSRFLLQKKMKPEGLDSSQELLSFARSRSRESIHYHLGDAGDSELLKDRRFDGIVCLLAAQNMESIEPVFRNVARWLEPRGKFVMVITHPCFRIPRQAHWGWDEEKKIEYRRVDLYASEMKIPIVTPPFVDPNNYTWTYHRPLQSYFEALLKAGLCVDLLEEWKSDKESSPGKRSRGENRARREIPLFMAIRAVLAPETHPKNK
ncbi:MAG: class I SAM-dependent methyltransferase [Nitrospinae bacterium]|nr:class I SAM-dependent methyltransferase [Nitrospinota bacterium]